MQDEDDGPTCQSHGPDMLHLLMQQPSQFFCPLICNLTKRSFYFLKYGSTRLHPHIQIYTIAALIYTIKERKNWKILLILGFSTHL